MAKEIKYGAEARAAIEKGCKSASGYSKSNSWDQKEETSFLTKSFGTPLHHKDG